MLKSVNVVGNTACNVAGQFIDISHLKSAGLDELDNRRLFVRASWASLWTELTGTKNLLLTGPPGIGKSSLVWAWCCWSASQKQSLRWIHITRTFAAYVVDFSQNGTFTAFTTDLDALDVPTNAPLLVIDGITKDLRSVLGQAEVWWTNDSASSKRLILVSCLQFSWGGEDYLRMNMLEIFSPGWGEHEYVQACKDAAFLTSVDAKLDADHTTTVLEERIESKFFIAGASARWMFHLDSKQATDDVKNQIRKVNNMMDVMSGLKGDRSEQAVNHVVSFVQGEHILVSELTTRELSKKCEAQFVTVANRQAMVMTNLSFNGWVFQMDFLFCLRTCRKSTSQLTLLDTAVPSNTETWPVPREVYDFYYESELNSVGALSDKCWLIPTKVNQGSYDALQLLRSQNKLRVVQLTRGKTHKLKLQYVISVIKTLGSLGVTISSLDVVIVCPKGTQHSFKLGTVYSDQYAVITNLGWKKSHLRKLGFQRTGMP